MPTRRPPFDLAELKTELDEYGFVVLHNAITVEQAATKARRLVDITREQIGPNEPNANLGGVLNYDPETFLPLLTHPVVTELARNLLGDGMQLAEVGGFWNKPGAPGQSLHTDAPYGAFPRPSPNGCFCVNTIWMLSEFSRANGGTLVMPFSHHWRVPPRKGEQYENLVAAEGPPGSVLVFHALIWHGRGANVTSDQERVGISVPYHGRGIDPRAGGWRLMTRAIRDRMPPEIQAMQRHTVERPGQRIGENDFGPT